MQPAQQQPPAYQQSPTQQQTSAVQQQPTVTVHQGSNATSDAAAQRGSWCWKGLRVTGYMQTFLGVFAVFFGILSIIVRAHLFSYGVPIWCGICFLTVAGILGIAAGGKQHSGLVVAYMVMSILSSLAAWGVIGVGGGAIATDTYSCPDYRYGNYYHYSSFRCSTSSGLRIAIDVCILLIGIGEFVIAIVGSSLTCCGLYYNTNSSRSAPQTMVTYQAYPQQMVLSAPPQGVYYPPGTTVAYPSQYVVQPAQPYQQPQGQFQPPPQGQFQPPLQGQFQPPPQGQFQPPPQGQFQPPPQAQFQPPPQQQVHPEAPLDPSKDEHHYQPLVK